MLSAVLHRYMLRNDLDWPEMVSKPVVVDKVSGWHTSHTAPADPRAAAHPDRRQHLRVCNARGHGYLGEAPPERSLDDIPVNVWGYFPIKGSMSLTVRDAVRYLVYRQLHHRPELLWREMNIVSALEPKYKRTKPQRGYVV
jgi:hypothetical protein